MAAVVAEQDNGREVVAMSRELSTYEAMGGSYTEVDGVFYPNIVVSEEADVWIEKYGLLWIDYMKAKRKYEEACKEWQQECVKAEIEATKDSQYYEEVVRVSMNLSR